MPGAEARRWGEPVLATVNGLALSSPLDDEFDHRGHVMELATTPASD